MKRTVQAAILTAFLMSTAQADDCIENAQDQAEMNTCAQMDYLAVNATLTKHIKEIRQRIGEDDKTLQLFNETEKTWIAFRDAECAFTTSKMVDSSSYAMAKSICMTDLTKKRSEQLLKYLNCAEGDLNCPTPTLTK